MDNPPVCTKGDVRLGQCPTGQGLHLAGDPWAPHVSDPTRPDTGVLPAGGRCIYGVTVRPQPVSRANLFSGKNERVGDFSRPPPMSCLPRASSFGPDLRGVGPGTFDQGTEGRGAPRFLALFEWTTRSAPPPRPLRVGCRNPLGSPLCDLQARGSRQRVVHGTPVSCNRQGLTWCCETGLWPGVRGGTRAWGCTS